LPIIELGYKQTCQKRKGHPLVYRDTLKEVKFHDDWTEKDIDDASKAGGIIAVIDVYRSASEKGETMTLEQAIAFALGRSND